MSTFADAFREIVVPDLRQRCRSQGLFVALGIASFADAQTTVMRAAIDRGAGSLPDDKQLDLEEWICTSILRASDDAGRRRAEYRAIADGVAAEIARVEAVYRERVVAAEMELTW